MGVLHPYMDRRNTNIAVLRMANAAKGNEKGEPLRTFSEYDLAQRRTLFGQVLRAALEDPLRQVTFFGGTGAPKLAPKNRVGRPIGRPRMHWTLECYTQIRNDLLGRPGEYRLGQAEVESTVLQEALDRRF